MKTNLKKPMRHKYGFAEIIDIDQLRTMLIRFTKINRINADIQTLPDHNLIKGLDRHRFCTEFHHPSSSTQDACNQYILLANQQPGQDNQSGIYLCPNGMANGFSAIVAGGIHVANLFIGQVFLEPPDRNDFRDKGLESGLFRPALFHHGRI